MKLDGRHPGTFTEEYKYKMFMLWYNNGKPIPSKFYNMMTPNDEGEIPTRGTVTTWISSNFKPQSEILDNQVRTALERKMIKEKVEMLSRHAELGRKMQDIGIEFIEGKEDELTSATAVRLLVAGVEIERESRGIPEALENIMNQSDEKLLDRITELTKNAPVEISPV